MAIAEPRQQALTFLRQSLGDPTATFREGQWEAIEALVERGARLLVVQRTGWGKSLVYFMATHVLRAHGSGPTLLISPLLSLMRNQIVAARRAGLSAAAMNSSNYHEWQSIVHRLRRGKVDLLMITPERLADTTFRNEILGPIASHIGLFVVDEAHCISDWGHDFRPDYRRIVQAITMLAPKTPVLATTATANKHVIKDMCTLLGPDFEVIRGSLVRESLRLQNICLPAQSARLAWLVEQLPRLPGSGIIYTLTVADAVQVARWLQRRDIDAHAYYGRLAADQRETLERQFLHNEIKVLVATSALGMGFDKPDIHFVIHFQRPASLVHYYQQVGRAGRALDEAYGVLLDGADEDQAIIDYFTRIALPPDAYVEAVLDALHQAEDGATPEMLQRNLNLTEAEIAKVLRQLAATDPAPVVKRSRRWYATSAHYEPDDEKIAQLTAMRHDEQARMAAYVGSSTCLMCFLVGELDDPHGAACSKCAVCSQTSLPATYSQAVADRAVEFLRRNDQWIEPHRDWPTDALAAYGWQGRIPPGLQAQRGRSLCRWGDDGWGNLVREGKRRGSRDPGVLTTLLATVQQLFTGRYPTAFDERLVAAMVALVRDRWRPTPSPTWVTCVPSLKHPTLVPQLARRIAQELRLPFVPCVRKCRATEPQKTMQNDYQQAHNLENAFAVEPDSVRNGPVLVVDDMVDSGWTLTVVAALLRDAGSGPVFPLALAVTTRTGDR